MYPRVEIRHRDGKPYPQCGTASFLTSTGQERRQAERAKCGAVLSHGGAALRSQYIGVRDTYVAVGSARVYKMLDTHRTCTDRQIKGRGLGTVYTHAFVFSKNKADPRPPLPSRLGDARGGVSQ